VVTGTDFFQPKYLQFITFLCVFALLSVLLGLAVVTEGRVWEYLGIA
jgi:hypothetical protein